MALAEHASSPAAATGSGGGNPLVATTASFSPPAGSLLLAMALGGRSSGSLQVACTISSSPSQTWTVAANAQGAGVDNGGVAQIAYVYLASAPGSMTVSASLTNLSSGRSLVVKVITGALANQTGAASATKVQATASTDGTIGITTTAADSLVYGGSVCQNSNPSLTLNGSTSLVNDYNNTTATTRHVHWKANAVTVTPGAVTLGGTWSGAQKHEIAAFEVLAAPPPPIGKLVFKQQAVNRSYFY